MGSIREQTRRFPAPQQLPLTPGDIVRLTSRPSCRISASPFVAASPGVNRGQWSVDCRPRQVSFLFARFHSPPSRCQSAVDLTCRSRRRAAFSAHNNRLQVSLFIVMLQARAVYFQIVCRLLLASRVKVKLLQQTRRYQQRRYNHNSPGLSLESAAEISNPCLLNGSYQTCFLQATASYTCTVIALTLWWRVYMLHIQ